MDDPILPIEQRHQVEIFPANMAMPIAFADLFGNNRPVELEIGIGKGLFLEYVARQNPATNYLGIDYARKYFKRAVDRISKRPIYNVRLALTEALSFLRDALTEASLQAVHVYYPDPWPKKRHHKRRLINQDFITEVDRILVPGGTLLMATDHEDYWTWIEDVMNRQTLLAPTGQMPEVPDGLAGLTSFQIKYLKEGRPVFRAGYAKPS